MNDRHTFPDLDRIRELPTVATTVISEQWEDMNGHVNVGFYMSLYNEAGWPTLELIGIDQSYFSERRMGIVDLENHIRYLDELHVGDRVTAYSRYLGHDEKRVHGIMFVVNDTTNVLASSIEFLSISMDLGQRRAAAIPGDIAAKLADITSKHERLGWTLPTRPTLRLKSQRS